MGNQELESNVRNLCGSESIWTIKQFEVERDTPLTHAPMLIAGDTDSLYWCRTSTTFQSIPRRTSVSGLPASPCKQAHLLPSNALYAASIQRRSVYRYNEDAGVVSRISWRVCTVITDLRRWMAATYTAPISY